MPWNRDLQKWVPRRGSAAEVLTQIRHGVAQLEIGLAQLGVSLEYQPEAKQFVLRDRDEDVICSFDTMFSLIKYLAENGLGYSTLPKEPPSSASSSEAETQSGGPSTCSDDHPSE